jgi:hypothetical protein
MNGLSLLKTYTLLLVAAFWFGISRLERLYNC